MWRNVSNKALPRNLSISHSSNSILPSCSSKGVSNLPETITRAVRTNSRRDSRFMEMEEEGMEKLKFQFLRHPFSLYEMGCSQNTKFFAQQEGFRIGSLGINYGKNSISLFNRGKLAEFKCFRYPISSFEMGLCQNEELVNRRDGFRIGSSSLQWETPPISSSSIGFCQNGKLLSRKSLSFGFPKHSKCYASVAEAICSTDADEDVVVMDEVQENLGDMIKEERRDFRRRRKRFQVLRRRQLKIETEAWIETTNDYKEYFSEMCKHKRAPNLPPVKMLFLGWFEPLCNAIAAEQEKCSRNPKLGHAAFFNQLPVEMMAVITMHTLTGLLMTGDEHGRTATVQAAGKIGEAIEHEVGELDTLFHLYLL
ncbi:hypothetical protein GIB67_012174 [Kingdonia uniflora]|uniref:DNA-directed RNA polymerase N-terminal domain-containing protein n=1 Tax=Kingdonia uniflora TaxID=39325 RepID=A0A7J7NNN6_9MAGN|nr:hypothetical protein GIB67_012174 [Kingdonia uniflora]